LSTSRDAQFPFADNKFPPSLGAVVQRTVASGELPALVVIHDDENDWLVSDGVNDPNEPGASIVFHLSHLVERDRSIGETATLPLSHVAWRKRPEDPWTIEKWSYGEE
jgi:hypothetical protein